MTIYEFEQFSICLLIKLKLSINEYFLPIDKNGTFFREQAIVERICFEQITFVMHFQK